MNSSLKNHCLQVVSKVSATSSVITHVPTAMAA